MKSVQRSVTICFVVVLVAGLIALVAPMSPASATGPGSISGLVYVDRNGNRAFDPTEERGIPDVALQAKDVATGGLAYSQIVTTAPDGTFAFMGWSLAIIR